MHLKTFALATALALSSSLAFAQAGGNDAGATVSERSGTAVNGGGGAVGTVHNGRTMNRAPGTTTGMSRGSTSGPSAYPGGPDRSRIGGQSPSRNPPE
jgi:hypothetical protein